MKAMVLRAVGEPLSLEERPDLTPEAGHIRVRVEAYKAGGAEHDRWVFDYDVTDDDEDESGFHFGSHTFLPANMYRSTGLTAMHTFAVHSVDPLKFSIQMDFEIAIYA